MTMKQLTLAFVSAGLMTIYGCGGGGGGGGSSAIAPSGPAFQGIAATGAALANAIVTITNNAGNSPCTEASITTTALGSYTCTLKSGEMAPFFVVVTDPTGNTSPLVSIATTTPAAGSPLTVNVTPLTTAIVAQLSTDGNALTVVSSQTVDPVKLQTITVNVVAQLSSVLTAINAPAGYDPFATNLTAATASNMGNTADKLLDVVKIVMDPSTGKLALSTIGDPTPIILATATTGGNSVATPAAGVSTLSQAAQLSAQAFTACFALSTSQRVVNTTSPVPTQLAGGPEVNDVDPACQNLTASLANAAATKFIQNGQSAGQFFYSILTSDSMTCAKFSVPEIMAFYPADINNSNSRDRAILNIRYVDTAGNPGNVITLAANFPGTTTSTRPTNWWLLGNQQLADTAVRLAIRRVEQFNTGTLPQTAAPSRFQSGIQFIISTNGPNSNNYSSAQVTGPGLPTSGLWYFSNSSSSQPFMDLSSYRGAAPSASTPPYAVGGGCTSNCPLFWFGKTTGITGSTTSYAVNPNSTYWAKGSTADGSFNGGSGTRPKKGDVYAIKLYSGNTLYLTYSKTLLSDLVDPALGSQLPWNTSGAMTNAALDPNNAALNGQQSSLSLDWTQNIAAQQIRSAQATTIQNGSYSESTNASKGATSVTISSAPTTFTGLSGTLSTSNGFRGLIFNYRMLDGSAKSALYTYN